MNYLNKYINTVDKETLLGISVHYSGDEFVKNTLQNLPYNKLLRFILTKKYNDFSVFLQNFMNYTHYDAKIVQLINNHQLKVEKDTDGVKFSFYITNKNNINHNEVREISYLFDVFEDFCFANNLGGKEDYIIETNYNEMSILFSPNWNI